jgi:signal transduction histidine kinase
MGSLLAHLKDIALQVTQAAEAATIEQVLEQIAHASRELVHARYAALGVPDEEGGLRYFKVSGIDQEQAQRMGHLPRGLGLLGVIQKNRVALRLDNMASDPRSVGFTKAHPSMTSLLGVPIQLGDTLYGLLYLSDKEDGSSFSEQDQWLVEVMASYAALAIANLSLQEQRSRMAMLEDRERIGMELHDGVIQSIYAIGMQVQLLPSTSGSIQAEGFERVIQGLNTVIEDIRSYILNLKSSHYAQKTVRECFDDVILRLHVPDELTINLEAPNSPPPLQSATFESVCQIVNEAVSNIVRHAQATEASIYAQSEGGYFTVVIQDNGRGFQFAEALKRNGLGLRNIQQRVKLHGGEVSIETEPEKGTSLTITIPISLAPRRER